MRQDIFEELKENSARGNSEVEIEDRQMQKKTMKQRMKTIQIDAGIPTEQNKK